MLFSYLVHRGPPWSAEHVFLFIMLSIRIMIVWSWPNGLSCKVIKFFMFYMLGVAFLCRSWASNCPNTACGGCQVKYEGEHSRVGSIPINGLLYFCVHDADWQQESTLYIQSLDRSFPADNRLKIRSLRALIWVMCKRFCSVGEARWHPIWGVFNPWGSCAIWMVFFRLGWTSLNQCTGY